MLPKQEILKCIIFFFSEAKRGKIKTRQNQEMTSGPPADCRESLTKPKKVDWKRLADLSQTL
jgi:hypothetical protein